jgi:hypothetical protein
MCVRYVNGEPEETTLTFDEAGSMVDRVKGNMHLFVLERPAKNWEEFFKDFTYKPNVELDYENRLDFDTHYLHISMLVPDVNRPDRTIRISRTDKLPQFEYIGEEGALQWVRYAVQNVEMHEVDEWIHLRGRKVFDPHVNDAPIPGRR